MLYLVLNLAFIGIAVAFFFNKKLLNYSRGGHFWLTWLAIGVITLMDELTSLFYAPSEAHRYLGPIALVFIPITALVIHYMTTRMVEIAYILDNNKLKGGGVYNFSHDVCRFTFADFGCVLGATRTHDFSQYCSAFL